MSSTPLLDGKYQKQEVIGNGSYGKIYSAIDTTTGKTVALKRFKERIRSEETHTAILEEIELHKTLHHDRIITVQHSFENDKKDVFIVFELMDSDLGNVLRGTKGPLPLPVRKAYLKQTLEAIQYLHSNSILHRDLKPENLLIASDRSLKLTDFGFATNIKADRRHFKAPLQSRWYRGPELLYGLPPNEPSCDMWAVGCILGEMMGSKRPLFPGERDIDQLQLIFDLTGTPKEDSTLTTLPRYIDFDPQPPADFKTLFPTSTEAELDLFLQLLNLDHTKRPSAEQALQHPYFKEEPAPAPLSSLPDGKSFERNMRRYKKSGPLFPSLHPTDLPPENTTPVPTSSAADGTEKAEKERPLSPYRTPPLTSIDGDEGAIDSDLLLGRSSNPPQDEDDALAFDSFKITPPHLAPGEKLHFEGHLKRNEEPPMDLTEEEIEAFLGAPTPKK